ncbi:shugoshin 1 [Rhinophrynus dorsalis]
MPRERCLKQAFQDSLEDIKERMKEKRTKKMAKVATVNKALCTKVKILNNSSVAVKSYQANNKALALALEAEKSKTRQAQDLILHLKRDHQRLMFEIFMLRRKLILQQGKDSSESKLASLKDIIAKVAQNLLETANLLGPAHALCSNDDVSGKIHSCWSDVSQGENHITEKESELGINLSKNVSIRRRPSNLNICIEEFLPLEDSSLKSGHCAPEPEIPVPTEECVPSSRTEGELETTNAISPSKEDILPLANVCEVICSTPKPIPKQMPNNKSKDESRPGRERVRKGRADGSVIAHLKKPWENSKPRARSKSRERCGSKQTLTKEKMNSSLNSGDAYDFVCEESVHVTPFRQNKQDEGQKDNCSDKSVSEEELDDSHCREAPPTPRFGLSDVTNLSASTDTKKCLKRIVCEDERKSGTPIRKRRCTGTVNYAEPKISAKLRRGDPFTDTEFLNSPIFKQKDSKRKSLKRQTLSRYNEAFVGCGR